MSKLSFQHFGQYQKVEPARFCSWKYVVYSLCSLFLEQASKPQSYASSKLWLTDQPTDSQGWSEELKLTFKEEMLLHSKISENIWQNIEFWGCYAPPPLEGSYGYCISLWIVLLACVFFIAKEEQEESCILGALKCKKSCDDIIQDPKGVESVAALKISWNCGAKYLEDIMW